MSNNTQVHKLSNQESLLNELDIVAILKGFELVETADGLSVSNPPTVRISNDETVTDEDLVNIVK